MAQERWSQAANLQTFSSGLGLVFQKSFPQPSVFTVQFTIGGDASRESGGGANITIRRCYAIIEWTLGGVATRRVVSVYNGCSVSGVAQNVAIRVIDRSNALGTPFVYTYPVNVQLAPGSRPSQQQPPYLALMTNSGTIGTGAPGTATFQFGGSTGLLNQLFGFDDVGVISYYAFLYRDTPAAGSFRIRQRVNAAVGLLPGFQSGLFPEGWTPIAPGTQALLIENYDAAQLMFYYILLGIDG
jgi:hypothetical protein